MKNFSLIFCVAGLFWVSAVFATPAMVDDAVVAKDLTKGLMSLADKGKMVSSKILNPQLERTQCKLGLPGGSEKRLTNLYGTCADSVVVVGTVFKCGKCDNWHSSSSATAWVLTEDGVMVTNYHVFAGKSVAGFGIRTWDGKVAAVTEILAASKRDDVVLFKVSGSGFKPLALGPDAAVGSDLHIIAHPGSRYYTYTSGKVSRYYRKRVAKGDGPTLMSVTAEFARGSSGGPVMNSAGNVIGMVSSTYSIYSPGAPKTKLAKQSPEQAVKPGKKTAKPGRGEDFQMVIRNCVPVSAIRALIEPW
jgi:serine protease Do